MAHGNSISKTGEIYKIGVAFYGKHARQIYEGLKQLIRDEVSRDTEIYTEEAKKKRVNELFREVNHLNKLITDNLYLRMAKSFQIEKC